MTGGRNSQDNHLISDIQSAQQLSEDRNITNQDSIGNSTTIPDMMNKIASMNNSGRFRGKHFKTNEKDNYMFLEENIRQSDFGA